MAKALQVNEMSKSRFFQTNNETSGSISDFMIKADS